VERVPTGKGVPPCPQMEEGEGEEISTFLKKIKINNNQ